MIFRFLVMFLVYANYCFKSMNDALCSDFPFIKNCFHYYFIIKTTPQNYMKSQDFQAFALYKFAQAK